MIRLKAAIQGKPSIAAAMQNPMLAKLLAMRMP
jgi:hypothetical protein